MTTRPSLRRLFAAALFIACFANAWAQPAKRPIDHGDFDGWRTIATPTLSRDGKWLAYSYQPQDGDGDLIVREIATGKERREAVGALPPPITTPNEENPDAPPPPRAIRIAFTSDARFLVATTYPTKAELAAARKAKKKPEEMPKGGMLIINLATGDITRVANVKSMQVPAKGGAWLAYLKEEVKAPEAPKADESKPEAKAGDDADDDQARRPAAAAAAAAAAASGAKKEYGTELVLRDLAAGSERVFNNVADISFARDGKTLLYTVSSKAETDNGVYAVSPQSADAPVALLSGKGKYSKLTWDREQTQVAFLSDRDDAAAKVPAVKLYYWQRNMPTAAEAVSAATAGITGGMVVSDKGPATTIAFSRDGKKLYVPVAPPAKPARPADAQPSDEEKVVADLWRWNDDVVQPMQKVRATQERNRSYRGMLDIASRKYVQLGDTDLRTVMVADDGLHAVGLDDKPYRRMVDYDGAYSDVYVIDTATGARKLAVKQLRDSSGFGGAAAAQQAWSPDGKWMYFYSDKQWHVLNTSDGSTKNLTAKLGVAVHNEENDVPGAAGPYGAAGWTSDSASMLVYDRFDVWQVFADGRAARNLTRGEGRKTHVRLRLQRIEPASEDDEERGLDVKKPLYLRGESDDTRATGFFKTTFTATAAPQRLVWGDKAYRFVVRAQEADVLAVTATRFDTYPDLQITSSAFAKFDKVTDGDSQRAPFLWGSAELMDFKNAKGVALHAAVYKPADFDPKKKYPLIVYIYEKLSQDIHNFRAPTTGQNINFSVYTSNGYIVMTPDIVYTTGYPGQSAIDAVMPAIDTLAKQGFVDENAIGIQGHSWGGYQIAYMVTQTNRFRAAEAGAPVGNMTSAYSGIRWGSGLPRQFQYEQSQSRIGKTLQDAPDLFIANSAVFHAKNVKTPLLILANDNDDAVPWYQGIELFLALRRYGKEAYYLNYNGEYHALRRRADQKDFGRRMQQFFDHYLKGAPMPEWMAKGVPYIEREEEKLVFPAMKVGAAN